MSAQTIKCTTAVRKAHDTTAGLSALWHAAYDAVASDVAAGASLRDISDALKAVGVKASKDLVRDYDLASRLTVYGSDYDAALVAARTKKRTDGTLVLPSSIMFAHSVITGARTSGRGVRYVIATLDAMDTAIGDSDMTGDAVRKIIEAALRDLLAEKRAQKKEEKKDDDTPDTPDTPDMDDEEPGEEPAASGEPATLAGCLAAAAALLKGIERRLEAGETVTAEERDAFMSRASRVAGLLRADSAVAV